MQQLLLVTSDKLSKLWKTTFFNMKKTSLQPLQQPNKPKSTTQTQNEIKKSNTFRTCANKTPTTTKTKNNKNKGQQGQKSSPFSQIKLFF
jgi:hypothetical protein